MEKVIRLQDTYSFKDSYTQASKNGLTLRELIQIKEKAVEDPRWSGFLLDSVSKYHQARLGKFQDGAEGAFPFDAFTALDLNFRKPMFRTYAMRDMAHIYGGGAIEKDKGFKRNYNIVNGRLASGNSNKVNLVSVNNETLETSVYPITLGMMVGQIDLMKADQIGYDIVEQNGEAVRMSYQLELDKFAYVGTRGFDGTASDTNVVERGLLNQSGAPVLDLETQTTYTIGATKKIEGLGIDVFTKVFIGELVEYAKSFAFMVEHLPNKALFYPELWAWLTSPAYITGLAGTVYRSNLEYLQAQVDVWVKAQGGSGFLFEQLPYLSATADTVADPILKNAGTNSTGRIVIYRQDPYVMRSRLALDLTPGAVVYDAPNNAFRRNYVAFIGTPLNFYPDKAVRYIDNGTTVA